MSALVEQHSFLVKKQVCSQLLSARAPVYWSPVDWLLM